MKMIQNKNLIQKILLLLLVVVSFNFICPSVVNAADTTSLGGAVVEGIADLLTALGDGILNIIHRFAMGQDESLIHLTGSIWSQIGNVLFVLVCIIAAIALIWATAGLASHVSAALVGVAISGVTIAKVAIIGGFAIGGIWGYSNMPSNTLDLPVYSISPEEIFYGKIPLLNVNFFNPDKRENIYDETFTTDTDKTNTSLYNLLVKECGLIKESDLGYGKSTYVEGTKTSKPQGLPEYTYGYKEYTWEDYKTKETYILSYSEGKRYGQAYKPPTLTVYNKDTNSNLYAEANPNASYVWNNIDGIINDLLDKYGWNDARVYDYLISRGVKYNREFVKEWTANETKYKIIIKNFGTANETKMLYEIKNYANIASDLQPTIAKWYVTLRNVALVMSMSILVYVGIRMMLTSIASEKAKYKTMLVDWLIGVALIFVMQYIMVFATTINDEFIDLVSQSGSVPMAASFPYNDKLQWGDLSEDYYKTYEDNNGNKWVIWETNLMGNVRIALQNMREESFVYVGYVIVFLVLVFYTAFFIFTYLKRVLYMAFLTVIAPFVAMTYPIDKLNDGKAQAFNMWIKEYIFNLLIQPMHLLLYYILIISAMKLATENVIYALVAIGFMIPAEKLIRKFFGFDKAQTPGFLGGAAGAGIVMSAVGSLRRFSSGGKGGSKDEFNRDADGKIRTKDSNSEKLNPHNLFGGNSESVDNNSENIRMNSGSEISSSSQTRAPEEQSSEVNKSVTESAEETNKQITKSEKTTYIAQNNGEQNAESKASSTDNNTPIRRRITGALRGVAVGGARSAGRLVGKIPNLAARGLGAATLGAVGLAAGIATGDASNALQYALTGAGAGSALGSGISNRANNAFDNITEDAMRGWYGGDYNAYANIKSDERFLRSKENRDFYRSMFGDDYKAKMDEAVKYYRSRGITDNKIIAKAMKLKDAEYSLQDKVFVADLASKINSTSDWARARDSFTSKGVPEDKIKRIEKAIVSIKKLPL